MSVRCIEILTHTVDNKTCIGEWNALNTNSHPTCLLVWFSDMFCNIVFKNLHYGRDATTKYSIYVL